MEGTKTQQELRAELIGKAAADDGFRAKLIADPRAAVKEALNIDLPESLTVHVHEETALSAHVVLPPAADLTDADLEAVAAGHWSGTIYDEPFLHKHGPGTEYHY